MSTGLVLAAPLSNVAAIPIPAVFDKIFQSRITLTHSFKYFLYLKQKFDPLFSTLIYLSLLLQVGPAQSNEEKDAIDISRTSERLYSRKIFATVSVNVLYAFSDFVGEVPE